jgi:hypothetical protein
MVSAYAGHHPVMSTLPVGARRPLSPYQPTALGGSETAPAKLAPELTHGCALEALAYAASRR